MISVIDVPFYVVMGLPMLLLAQFTDLWDFVKESYSTRKPKTTDGTFVLSEEDFFRSK